MNLWTQFLEDFKLIDRKSKFCKKSDMDRLFIAVDTASARLEAEQARLANQRQVGGDEKQKELNRVEFVTCLCHIAINKYVLTGEMNDVSDALKRLLEVDIQSQMKPGLLANPNTFREAHAYTRPVSEWLKRNEKSLRTLFVVLAGGGRGIESQLLSLDEWKDFCRATSIIAADVTEREATLAFVWSRMCVIDGRSERGHVKETQLPFEGFLECICRVAAMKAFPTDEEIFAYGCRDAAEYLTRLKKEDATEYERLLQERATPWGDAPPQPMERCIAHIVSFIIHAIEDQCGRGNADGQIDSHEATAFWTAAKKSSH